MTNTTKVHTLKADGNTYLCTRFDTLTQWFDYASGSRMSTESGSFTGYKSFSDLVKACKSSHILDSKITSYTDKVAMPDVYDLAPQHYGEGNALQYDSEGFYCDYTSYLMGEEFPMLNIAPDESARPIVWIASSMGAQYNVEPSQFAKRGAVIIRAIEALQTAGYSVGVIAYTQVYKSLVDDIDGSLQMVTIKQPDHDYNRNQLLNILGSATALRTAGFKARARMENKSEIVGETRSLTPDLAKQLGYDTNGLVVFGTTSRLSEYNNPAMACAELVKQAIDKANNNNNHQQQAA